MNVVLLADPAGPGVVVFDAGEQGMAPAILAAGRARGGVPRVVLGHGDTDHRGAAPAIARAGIPVACHSDAVARAEGSGGRDSWRPELLPPAVRRLHRVTHHVWDGGPVRITELVRTPRPAAGAGPARPARRRGGRAGGLTIAVGRPTVG